MGHARRQQYRDLARSAAYALSAAVIFLVVLSAQPSRGETPSDLALVLVGAGFTRAARLSQRLAGRWRIGANSERAVQLALNELARRRWAVRNGVRWPGGGDIDHLVRSPEGVGFAIETKTRAYTQAHVRRTLATARWLARRRRRYPHGVVPILCVVGARQLESRYGTVVVVSLDRLLAVLERLAHSTAGSERPAGRRPRDRADRSLETAGRNPLHARVAGATDG
jgi:Nuclease-related domain